MEIQRINPLIQDISINKTAKENDSPFSHGKRKVIAYELERIASSYGTIILNGVTHHLKENDIFFRKPGQTVEGIMPYRYQYLIFTMEGINANTIALFNALPDKLNISHFPIIIRMFDEIQYLYLSSDETAPLLIKARILELLYEFHAHAQKARYNKYIKAAIQFIESNYSEQIRVEDIALKVGVSQTYLFRQFKQILNDTPMSYLNKIRLSKSKSLLLESESSIMSIAMTCGYTSVSYFDYTFKSYIGLSPTDFRKRYIRRGCNTTEHTRYIK